MSDEPKITYPCDYPIKVVGEAHVTFQATVFEIASRHDTTLTEDRVTLRESKAGNFLSVTLILTAESEEQIQALFAELNALEFVRLVL